MFSTNITFFAPHFHHPELFHFPSITLNPTCENSSLPDIRQYMYSHTNEFLYDRVNAKFHYNTYSHFMI